MAAVMVVTAAAALLLAWSPVGAAEAGAEELVPIYFGAGCFWHVQHEFILAEQDVLGRASSELTAISGYAGGTRLNPKGKACYYDYGVNGHTEVVELLIPRDSVAAFAKVFWSLFVGKNRVDTMDVGSSYRAAVGLPGGSSSPLLAVVNSSQEGHVAQRFQLHDGVGNDRDTLGEALVWVYDSDRFPFHQAELYHQFHDDFMPGGNYPQAYNSLKTTVLDACRILPTNCPQDVASPPEGCRAESGDSQVSSDEDPDTGGAHPGGSGGSGGGWVGEAPSKEQPEGPAEKSVSSSSTSSSNGLHLERNRALLKSWMLVFTSMLGSSLPLAAASAFTR